MSSLKELIFDALIPLGIPVAYNDSDISQLPRINYNLISNLSIRLSNKKHRNKVRYQIDYFSKIPLDIEADDVLIQIEVYLNDKGIKTSNWIEIPTIDLEADIGLYRYYMEVWL